MPREPLSHTLNEAALAFLREPRFAVLATVNPDMTPQQTTVWYELRENAVVMNTRAGRLKERNLELNPHASICVEDGYRYVTLSGPVILDKNQEVAHADIRALAIRYHGQEKGEELSRETYEQQERVTIIMRIAQVVAYGFE